MSYAGFIQIQHRLASRVRLQGRPRPRLFCALDMAAKDEHGRAAAVVMDRSFQILEERVAEGRLRIPYVPGFLSFREAPLALKAFRQLKLKPDVILVDGQGLAHPRAFGLACHIGVLLNLPTIGCAKSLLVGEFHTPPNARGGTSPLIFKGRQVGWSLRTRPDVKPIFVSPGHRVAMNAVCRIVMQTTTSFRIPEPLRRADRLSKFPP